MSALPANIYEQQASNRRKTVLVMMLFVCLIALLGFGFDSYVLGFSVGDDPGRFGFSLPYATLAAIGFGSISALWSLRGGATSVLTSSGALAVAPDDPRYRQLSNVVDEISIAAGLPRPRLYVIPDPDPNAFATGKDPEHASVAVTAGLLEKLDRDELQGVIAHEMSHVRNYDIRLMTVTAALVGSVMLIAEFGLRSMQVGAGRRRSSSSRGGGGGALFLLLWVIAMLLAPLIARLLAMGVSRQREFLADASGAELTRNPAALASALAKIDASMEPTRAIKKGTAPLCIADPLGSEVNDREGFFANLFATHPPIAARIKVLRGMAYQHV